MGSRSKKPHKKRMSSAQRRVLRRQLKKELGGIYRGGKSLFDFAFRSKPVKEEKDESAKDS